MVFSTTCTRNRRPRLRGVTLFELLIAMSIAAILLVQVCSLWFYSSRSFASQMAYVELDQNSQRALDTLTRDVRQAKSLTSYDKSRLVFLDIDDKPLEFIHTDRTLLKIKNGVKTVLLTECDELNFGIFQRNPVAAAYDYYPTADPATCKMIEVRWNCSRKLFPTAPSTTESVQSAKIVMRSP